MRVYKNAWFQKFARKEKISDDLLCKAIRQAQEGLIDADLGAGLIKQRVARSHSGKSGGYRTFIFFRTGLRAIFVYGFAKNRKANLDPDEEVVFRKAAKLVLSYSQEQIDTELAKGRLVEVECSDQDLQK